MQVTAGLHGRRAAPTTARTAVISANGLLVDQRLPHRSTREVRCRIAFGPQLPVPGPPTGLPPLTPVNLRPPPRDYGKIQEFLDGYVDEATYYNPFPPGIDPIVPPVSNLHHFGMYDVQIGRSLPPQNKLMRIDEFGMDGATITWPDGTALPGQPAAQRAVAPNSGVIHKPVFIMSVENRQEQKWERWELDFYPVPQAGWQPGNAAFFGTIMGDGAAAPISVLGLYAGSVPPRFGPNTPPRFTPKQLCTKHLGETWQPTYGTQTGNEIDHFDDPQRANKPYWGWVLSLGFASEETRQLLNSFANETCRNGLLFKYNTWWDNNNIGYVNKYRIERDPTPLRENPNASRPFKYPRNPHPLVSSGISDGNDWMFMYIDAIFHAWAKEREDYAASQGLANVNQVDSLAHRYRKKGKGGMLVVLSKSYFTKEVKTFDPVGGIGGRGAWSYTLVRNDNCMRELAYLNRYREARIPVKFMIVDKDGRQFFNTAIRGKLIKPESLQPDTPFTEEDVIVDYAKDPEMVNGKFFSHSMRRQIRESGIFED